MIKLFHRLTEGISEVLFPTICAVCGLKLTSNENCVCNICLNNKFEKTKIKRNHSTSDLMLPEGISMQHALWNFDKGGYLQGLLHQLKYNRLTGVGEDIGRQLGKSLLNNPGFSTTQNSDKALLIPVPLHPRKRRIRGFNQAFYIAKGVSEVIGLPIVKQNIVQRIKNTRTQTGFSLEKRRKNIDGAFRVTEVSKVENKTCIIVDDVFTTGATTFELAAILNANGSKEIMIATVAQA